MKVIGVTDKGVIVEMTDDEIMRACGFQWRRDFDDFLEKIGASEKRSGHWKDAAPKAGTELPLADWHKMLCNLRSKAGELSKVGETMRGFADIIGSAVDLTMGRIDADKVS
jgi:hypothetical protein